MLRVLKKSLSSFFFFSFFFSTAVFLAGCARTWYIPCLLKMMPWYFCHITHHPKAVQCDSIMAMNMAEKRHRTLSWDLSWDCGVSRTDSFSTRRMKVHDLMLNHFPPPVQCKIFEWILLTYVYTHKYHVHCILWKWRIFFCTSSSLNFRSHRKENSSTNLFSAAFRRRDSLAQHFLY